MPRLLYYITDRSAFPGNESARRDALLAKIFEAASAGIDYIQLREKDLSTRQLESLAREAVETIHQAQALKTALLINSRPDIALVTGADGVHLRSDDISPNDVRKIYERGAGAPAGESLPRPHLIAVSCHAPEEVAQAATQSATFAVFGPVFEKKDTPDKTLAGLTKLREACRFQIPVLALGGITIENAQCCLEAGASGIAAIRLFQENDVAEVVQKLRQRF